VLLNEKEHETLDIKKFPFIKVWCCTPVIPAMRKVKLGDILAEASQAKVRDPILKIN
jgi:hypothetical protein